MQPRPALFVAVLLLTLGAAAPARAITFASGRGADAANCGSVAAPCRTLQQAVNVAPPGGYVVLLDAADFGPVHIQKSISISAEAAGATVRGSATNLGRFPVLIEAGPNDVVRLRGLTIDGASLASDGIDFFTGKFLEVANCVVRNFVGPGIYPTAGGGAFSVVDTTASGNGVGLRAITLSGKMTGFIDGLRLNNNGAGLSDELYHGGKIVAVNSSASGHPYFGFSAAGEELTLRNTTASHNRDGLATQGDGAIVLSRSTVVGNTAAVKANGGGVVSSGDNIVRGNGDDALGLFAPFALR